MWWNSSHGTLLQIAATLLVEIIFGGNYSKCLRIPSSTYVYICSPLYVLSFIYLSALPKVQPTGGGKTSFQRITWLVGRLIMSQFIKLSSGSHVDFSLRPGSAFYNSITVTRCKSPITKSTIKKNKQTYFCTSPHKPWPCFNCSLLTFPCVLLACTCAGVSVVLWVLEPLWLV